MATSLSCSHDGCTQKYFSTGRCRDHYKEYANALRRADRAANSEAWKAKDRLRYELNREKKKAEVKAYRDRNKELVRERDRLRNAVRAAVMNEKRKQQRLADVEGARQKDRERYQREREVKLERAKDYAKRNRPACNARGKLRAERKRRQAPAWLTDLDREHFKLIYEAASALSKEFGVLMHVDHIVPLRGENVSGLHVPWNLQVIPARENHEKSNRFNFEEYRDQWLSKT